MLNPYEFHVSYRSGGDYDRTVTCPTLDSAKSRARRLSGKHGYAVAERYRVNSDDDGPLRTLLTEWVYANGRLDFRNDLGGL